MRNGLWWKVAAVTVVLFLLIAVAPLVIVGPSPYRHEDRVSSDLRLLRSVLELYRDQHGRYPSTSEGLEVLKSEGYVMGSGFGVDVWGSDLMYESKNGTTRLYSAGRNRIDENGRGDDVSIELQPE